MCLFGIILVRIFPHSDWIRRDTEYISVVSPNVAKCGPEQLQIQTLFTQWISIIPLLKVSFKSQDTSMLLWPSYFINRILIKKEWFFVLQFICCWCSYINHQYAKFVGLFNTLPKKQGIFLYLLGELESFSRNAVIANDKIMIDWQNNDKLSSLLTIKNFLISQEQVKVLLE